MGLSAEPTFFATPAGFRRWLARHHESATHLWVGFHKRATGRPTLTWPQSVEEALAFGWIDGLRKRIDGEAYMIRFSPRQPRSIWSKVNVATAERLIAAGRMQPAGLAAFQQRSAARTGVYSSEQKEVALPPAYARIFRAAPDAWRFFRAQPPWYRRTTTWYVISAKREATRRRRLDQLIADSAAGEWLKPIRAARGRPASGAAVAKPPARPKPAPADTDRGTPALRRKRARSGAPTRAASRASRPSGRRPRGAR